MSRNDGLRNKLDIPTGLSRLETASTALFILTLRPRDDTRRGLDQKRWPSSSLIHPTSSGTNSTGSVGPQYRMR
jgi:hypothetical protein